MCAETRHLREADQIAGVNSGRRRRDLISLYVDILNAIGSGARKSHIVYRANLNFNRCERYIAELLRMELIRVESISPPQWSVTEKGKDFLRKYSELQEILET
jgi:predicted transcriptional regulator